MTEPQPTKLFSTGLIYSCFAWTPIPLGVALVWDATRAQYLFAQNSTEFGWGMFIGSVGVLMALIGLCIAGADSDLHDRDAPGHPYAVFGAWSNASALVILVALLGSAR